MESFFLSETTKYLYLLFDTDNFIHNQGQYGTVIDTPNGECVIEAGGYIFNTEAHPVDPAALHCCYSGPNNNIFDFKALQERKIQFKGETIKDRKTHLKSTSEENKETAVASEEELGPITTESSNTYVKLEDNDNISQKISNSDDEFQENTSVRVEEVTLPTEVNQIILNEKKFDVQEMLERFRNDSKFARNSTWENNYKILSCRSQPFLQKLSILGEFFNK